MALAAGAVLIAVGMVAAQSTDPSATRALDTRSVAAGGGPVVATITVSGATQAVVTETLPTGFAYVSSSLLDNQVRPDPDDSQLIRFVLADSADNPFTYTVTVSEAGSIEGKLTVDRVEYDVTGDGMVTVQEGTDPSATRALDTRSVAAGGGPVVATITVSGATQAVVTETLPTGFAYVSSSLLDNQVRPDPDDSQLIRFVLADSADNPFTYTVTVSEAGSIEGKLTVDRVEYDVTGDGMVTVQEGTDPSATRALDTRSVAAGGGPVVATITVSGATQAVVTETLPTGFAYVSSSLLDSQVRPDPNDSQRILFDLADSADNPFTYTVTVSEAGSIEGKLTVDRVEYDVTGDGMVTVQEGTDPSATRALDTRSVAAGGGPVVATITVSGATQAVVTETLPTGFAYVSSSLLDSQVRPDPNDSQRILFDLADSADNPFTYTVTVSEAGSIEGKLTVDRVEYDVTGDGMVTVQEGTDPSATRALDTRSVAAGGGPVVATITVSGATQAVVTETLPTGFAYVSSSLLDSQVRPDPDDSQLVRFVLADSADNPFTYTVTVSEAGSIEGKLTVDRVEYDVTGDGMVTVRPSPSTGGGGGGGGTSNRAPVFRDGATAARSVAEDAVAGAPVGSAVTASDSDGDSIAYSLAGDDASLFAIDPRTGQVSVGEGTALDFETKSSYAVTARAADRRNSSDTIALTITVTNVGLDDSYDANDDGMIDGTEVLNAVEDYFNDVSGIDSERILDIVELYFNS